MDNNLRQYLAVIQKHHQNLFTLPQISELDKLNIKNLEKEFQESIINTYRTIKNSVLIESDGISVVEYSIDPAMQLTVKEGHKVYKNHREKKHNN